MIDFLIPDNLHQLLTPEATPVLFWAGFAAVTSMLVSALVKKNCRRRWEGAGQKPGMGQRWVLRLLPLLAPVLSILILMTGSNLLQRAGLDTQISATLLDIFLSWTVIAAVYAVTQSRGKTFFSATLIVVYTVLSLLNVLPEISAQLEKIALTVGKTKITMLHFITFLISIVLLSWVVSALVAGIDYSFQHMTRLRSNTRQLFTTLSRTVIYIIAFLVALNTLGIDLTAFAIFGGALGVGLGFGLQKIASNFISGIILLVERSIDVGDMVEIATGTAPVLGLVKYTGARYTLIETFDNREVMIPNEDFMTNRVINWTYSSPRGLVKVPVIVAYDSDLDRAKELMLEAAREHPRCLKDPAPFCLLQEFTDLAVVFQLNMWIGDIRQNRLTTQSDLLFAVWKKLTANGIGIPHQARITQLSPAADIPPPPATGL